MRYGLLINLDRCSGCDSCVVACKLENGLGLGDAYNRVHPVGPLGTFPNVEKYWVPFQCQQCANAACVDVCPTGASFRSDVTGAVQIDQDACIGCQLCVNACPFGARTVNLSTGIAQKCTLCRHITENGDEVPACVHNCNCGARFYGDYDDPDSDVCQEMAKYGNDCIHALADDNGADPTTRYILSPNIAAWQGTH